VGFWLCGNQDLHCTINLSSFHHRWELVTSTGSAWSGSIIPCSWAWGSPGHGGHFASSLQLHCSI
jgi:hypothetical protein